MNGWECQRDIPHISRATTALLCLAPVWKDTAKRLGVAAVEGRQRRVVLHLRVRWPATKDLQVRTGGECSSLKTAQDFGPDLLEVIECPGTHNVPCCGQRRDNIRCIAALSNNAMHAIRRPDVLTQQPDSDLRHGQRICCIDTQLRIGGSVRFLPRV